MKWFNNLKVGAKVLLASLMFIILITIIAVQGIMSMNSADEGFNKIYNQGLRPIRELNKMAANLLQVRINMLRIRRHYQVGTKDRLSDASERIKKSAELRKENDEIWKKYFSGELAEGELEKEEKAEAEKFKEAYDKSWALFDEFIKASIEKDDFTADKLSENWVVHYRNSRDSLIKLLELIETRGRGIKDIQHADSRSVFILSLVLLAASIFVGIIVTIILSRAVSKPVQKGLDFARTIADGDFTQRIDLDQNDELGQLGKALNEAANNLENVINDIVGLAEKLAVGDLTGRLDLDKKGNFGMLSKLANALDSSLGNLEKTVLDSIVATQNLSQAVDQISSGNQNLSQRTSEQASSLEEVASTIEEATATIRQNADNAVNAKDLSNNAYKLAENGGKVLIDAVTAINDINQLGKKIGDIISVINEIAFQTNLLALNAAVEAARAGEQGRGFAVVAGEVRNLAQRAGSSAKEINELIKNSLEKIDIGTNLVNQSGEALKEIIDSASKVAQLISEIASASEEQRQGIDQINTAIADMDTMTQQNAALVEETASASEEMANQAQELSLMMEKFNVSKDLKNETYYKKHKEVHLSNTGIEKAPKLKDKSNGGNRGNNKSGEDRIELSSNADEKKEINLSVKMQEEGFEEF